MTYAFGFTASPVQNDTGSSHNLGHDGYTEYISGTPVIGTEYFVKDDNPNGNAINFLNLGFGYQIRLEYNSDNKAVTPTLIAPPEPQAIILVDFIRVKAANAFIDYSDLILDGSELLLSVPHHSQDGQYHGISHISIAYHFVAIQPPVDPDPGSVLVTKNLGSGNAVHEGVTFTLTNNNGFIATGTTNSSGQITFSEVPEGTYTLTESIPPDFTTTYDNQVVVVSGETTEVNVRNNMIQNTPTTYQWNGSTIFGYKYNLQEQGLEGWTIQLWQDGEVIQSTTTNAIGYYEFTGLAEGTYIVREVMQAGWELADETNFPIEQEVVISRTFTQEILNLESDNYLIAAMPDGNIAFVAEGRIANNALSGDHEINIHTAPYVVQSQGDRVWANNGVPVPFIIYWDGNTLSFTVDGQTITYATTNNNVTDVMIRTSATRPDTGIMVNNLSLNGYINGNSVADGDETGRDILWLKNFDLSTPFTLAGQSIMYWEGTSPSGSNLAYQVKFGSVPYEGSYQVDFMNKLEGEEPEIGTLTINKQVFVDGEEITDSDEVFTFTVNGETVTASAVQAGVIDLPIGQYTVTETDSGDYTPDEGTQTVELSVEGANVTFINRITTIQPPVDPPPLNPPTSIFTMSIVKTADVDTVEIGDTINYTITVSNTGNATLTNVNVVDEMLGLNETIAILPVGSSQTFTGTFIAQTVGLLPNTASASSSQAPFVTSTATVNVVEPQEEIDVEDGEVPLGVPEEEIVPQEILEEEFVIEIEVPLAIPDTGVSSPLLLYGAGALLSMVGFIKKRR